MAKKEYKQLSCRDGGADCDFLVRAETEEEVLKVATDHACRVHGKCDLPQEKIRPLIKNVSV
jgi:predicted small metal-binding protein